MGITQLGESGGLSPLDNKNSSAQTRVDLGNVLGLSEVQLKEKIIAYMLKEFPTVEEFDKMPITGEEGWENYKISGVGGPRAICTKLGIDGLNASERIGTKGKNAVRKILYPELEEIIEKTKEETIAYMLEEFLTVGDFDKMPIAGEQGWQQYKIPGVGGSPVICNKLGIEGLSTREKSGTKGKNAVRKILYPEAKEIVEVLEKTKEETIEYMLEEFPTVEDFDTMPIKGEEGWEKYKIPGVGGPLVICTKLGIDGLNASERIGTKGKNEVRKILYPEAEEIVEVSEKTKEETIAYMLKEFPTVEDFDKMGIIGENGWQQYKILGVGGPAAICTKLGIDRLNTNEKTLLKGKNVVRKMLYPEAKEIKELTKEEIIEYILEEFPTVGDFDEMNWKEYSMLGVGGPAAICTKLGIDGLSGNEKKGSKGKKEVRKVLFPEAEEIVEVPEKTKEETIEYMLEEFPTVEEFDEMPIAGEQGWVNYKIPGVGGTNAICTKLGIDGLSANEKIGTKGKNEVRKILYPEAEEIVEVSEKTKEETIAYMLEEFPTVGDFDEMNWKEYSIPGVGGPRAICTKLGIEGLSKNEKILSKGKKAVRKVLYPEAEDIVEKTKEETIEYMLEEFPTVEDFDKMPVMGEEGWTKYNIPGVGGPGAICTKLGIDGLKNSDSFSKKGKNEVRKILYPEAEEIVEKTKEAIIAYMLEEFPTVEDFDKMLTRGIHGWEKYNIPGVGGPRAICTKLGINLKNIEVYNRKGKNEVRKILYPDAEEILTSEEQEEYLDTLLSSEELEQLIGVLGVGVTKDILYAQDERVKKISVELINSKISEYLGDFIVDSPLFDDRFWNSITTLLESPSLRDALLESLKQDMLHFYTLMKKDHPSQSDITITDEYFHSLVAKTNHIDNILLQDVIEELRQYISQIHDFEKPESIIDLIDTTRTLPDFGQKINIAEIHTKKRLLIADEMGLGKSASAILAKETLGVKKALVIAPHNVIPVWQGYLSDDPSGKGIFKQGQAPKVVEILEAEDLIDAIDADYVLFSQHRLNDEYAVLLKQLGCTMMIVDEQHKLKNTEGVWSNTLLDVVNHTLNPDDYMVLLSGTPSPNKVSDIAMALKLLFPEHPVISQMTPKELRRAIIEGNMLDLRGLLAQKMQAKKVTNSVIKLPALHETIQYVDLTDTQQKIYEALLDEDELTSTEKIHLLWKFLHNPKLLELHPDVGSVKLQMLRDNIQNEFDQGKKKIVVFVNLGISDVIAGDPSLMILDQLGLDSDVAVLALHGQEKGDSKVKKQKRADILHDFETRDGKTVLFVSGSVGDVGIDLTPGEVVIHYDEPWTLADKNQQVKRVHRSGLKHEVGHTTILTRNTIDEGIHQYIMEKQKIIDKLIYGIPLNEIEKDLLYTSERGDNPEHNIHLAKFYEGMMKSLNNYFGYMKDMGTEKYKTYIESHGQKYAEYYAKLGTKSYQGNVNRVAGTLIDHIVQEEFGGRNVQIADLGSGPCVLKKHIGEHYQSCITSIDGNKEHFTADMTNYIVASFDNIPVDSQQFDIVNMSLAFQDTGLLFTKKIYDRIETLLEINRILKEGGIALLQLPYGHDIKNTEYFEEIMEMLGFEIYQSTHGIITSGNNYESNMIALRKIYEPDRNFDEIIEQIKYMKDGLKIMKFTKKLKNARKIISQFEVGGQSYNVVFNEHDAGIVSQEREILSHIKALILQYGSIKNIPIDIIKENGYIWFCSKKSKDNKGKYTIIKILDNNEGLIIYND